MTSDVCPKCKSEIYAGFQWKCGTERRNNRLFQSDRCRITELENDVHDIDEMYASKMNVLTAENERLKEENAGLREISAEVCGVNLDMTEDLDRLYDESQRLREALDNSIGEISENIKMAQSHEMHVGMMSALNVMRRCFAEKGTT